jgi:hypothetical protein
MEILWRWNSTGEAGGVAFASDTSREVVKGPINFALFFIEEV